MAAGENRESKHLATRLLTENEALAFGVLHVGIKVAIGYPGTPSTGWRAIPACQPMVQGGEAVVQPEQGRFLRTVGGKIQPANID